MSASGSPRSISTSRQKSFTHYIENRRAWAKRARPRSQGSGAFLRGARIDAAARRERGDRILRFCRSGHRGRAIPRFRGGRHAGHRQLPDAARPFDGRHADHAAQRQLRRFRRARHRRCDDLRGHRRKPLRRDGAQRAPAAPADRRDADGLDRGAQPAVHAGLAQQAAGGGGPRRARHPARLPQRSTGSPSA